MHSSIQANCTKFARLVLAIAAGALLTSCSLLVDDALDNAPPQPFYGAPVACGYPCGGGNYAVQTYPGGPCECPMFGGAGSVAGVGGAPGAGATCGPAMVQSGSIGACLCPNGDRGTQTCWNGSFLTCTCPMLFVPDSDAGTESDAGADDDAGSAFF